MQSWFGNLVVFNRPCYVGLYVITKHNGTHTHTIAIQPGVQIILNFYVKTAAVDFLVTHAVLRTERRFSGPAGTDVVKCYELHVAKEIRRDRASGQSADQGDS